MHTTREHLQDAASRVELPPEIRFNPIGCPREAIDEANAAEQRTGESAFEPVEVAIERIRTESSPSQARLESWARHPDERVVIALLESDIVQRYKNAGDILDGILPRAILEAQNRGEVWTPVLDALSSSIWPMVGYGKQSEISYLEAVVDRWIERQDDPTVLRQVVRRTKSEKLICRIAELATIVDRALLEAVLEVCPSAVMDFAYNEHLPSELLTTLRDRIVNIATQTQADCVVDDRGLVAAYGRLARRGIHLQQDHIQRLSDLFEDHFGRSDESTQYMCRRALDLLNQYVCDTGDEEVALRIVEMIGKLADRERALRLLFDPGLGVSRLAITPRLVHAILDHCGQFAEVLQAVAEESGIRRDSEIRRKLLESRVPRVLLHLAQDDRPEEFAFIFRHVAPSHPEDAFDLLKRNRETARRTLSHTDLLSLLQASSRKVRFEAIAFLGELREGPKAGDSTIHRRAR